jgi:hypothetical protein
VIGIPCHLLISYPFQIKPPQINAPMPAARVPWMAKAVVKPDFSAHGCYYDAQDQYKLVYICLLNEKRKDKLTMAKNGIAKPQIIFQNTKLA